MAKVVKIMSDAEGGRYYFTNTGKAFGFEPGWDSDGEAAEQKATIDMIERGVAFLPLSTKEMAIVEALGKTVSVFA